MRHVTKLLAVLATAIGILVLYAGAYLASLKGNDIGYFTSTTGRDKGAVYGIWIPKYRYGGQYAQTFFGPAHFVDAKLRTARWTRFCIASPSRLMDVPD